VPINCMIILLGDLAVLFNEMLSTSSQRECYSVVRDFIGSLGDVKGHNQNLY